MNKQDTRRYFLFRYSTQWSVGNVLVAFDGFPSNLWLVEEAIPARAQFLPPGAHIVVTGWNEFANEQEFEAFTGGFSMGNEISKALGL